MAKKQKMSAKQKQARIEAAAAREAAAAEAKARKEMWKRIGIAVVAILLIAGLMVPTMAVSFCGNSTVEQQAAVEAEQQDEQAGAGQSDTLVEVNTDGTAELEVVGSSDSTEESNAAQDEAAGADAEETEEE